MEGQCDCRTQRQEEIRGGQVEGSAAGEMRSNSVSGVGKEQRS